MPVSKGPKVSIRPEAAEAVLALVKAGGGAGRANQALAEVLVSLLLIHPTTERAIEVEDLSRGELRAALLRLAAGEPAAYPKVSLDLIRLEAPRLGEHLRRITTDLSWLDRTFDLAFRHIPWGGELRGEIQVHFMMLGAGLYDGGAWQTGPVAYISLDLLFVDSVEDLVLIAAHECSHAAVHLYHLDPSKNVRWLEGCPPPVREILYYLYREGLARETTLGCRYRPDIENCFEAVQQALDKAKAGRAPGRNHLWRGEKGEGHLGGTAGAFIFETIFAHASKDERDRAIRGGPEGVLALYDGLAAERGLPRLKW